MNGKGVASMAININTIIAAVDVDDDLAKPILSTAADLSEIFGASLHIVDVVTPLEGIGTLYAVGPVSHEIEAHEKAEEENLRRLTSMISEITSSAKPVVVHGNPGKAVADYAQENNADLLIIGSHQKGWWGKLASGAASSELVREAPCAVYVVTKEAAQNMT
ncbi:MAG: universal stress protein [Geminicoccaceae bacterium]